MSLDKQTLFEVLWDIQAPDWHIGVFYDLQDPFTNLPAAEILGSRVPLMDMAYITGYMQNTAEVLVGPLPGCTVGGWFVAKGTTGTNIGWHAYFSVPMVVASGEHLLFAPNTIYLTVD